MSNANDPQITFEKIKVKGNELKEKVREIIEEGSARRLIIQKDGRTLLEFPLAIGLGGAAAAILIHAPLTAVGAIAALVTDVQIVIEREHSPGDSENTIDIEPIETDED